MTSPQAPAARSISCAPVRVCLITREYSQLTSYTGGIGTQFATLGPELVRQGHDTHVIVPPEASPYSRNGTHDGVTVHRARRHRLGWCFGVEDTVKAAGRFDVVFAPEWSGDAWWYSRDKDAGPLVMNLTTSLEQILALNAEWSRDRRTRLLHALQSRREQAQTESSDGLIACSDAILQWSNRLWKLEQLPATVIPNMIDVEKIRLLGAAARGAEDRGDELRIAFSGRLEIRKGVHVLVEAMNTVWEQFPSARLVLCGYDAPWRSMRDHLVRLAGGNRTKLDFRGNLPVEQLHRTLANADVVVFPSLWENFSVGALEAMALGLPIVATASGGFSEMIVDGESGILVAPRDSVALGTALAGLLGDAAERERLAQGAAARAERFDKERVTAEHVAFFEQVADRRG